VLHRENFRCAVTGDVDSYSASGPTELHPEEFVNGCDAAHIFPFRLRQRTESCSSQKNNTYYVESHYPVLGILDGGREIAFATTAPPPNPVLVNINAMFSILKYRLKQVGLWEAAGERDDILMPEEEVVDRGERIGELDVLPVWEGHVEDIDMPPLVI
ncbi:hypothetical protein HK104_007683, partial [Borealophlyctis nickersoniae]